RGEGARRGPRRRGSRRDRPLARDRRRDRQGRAGHGRRPDRARLGAALAPAVALLLADGRLRAQESAVRGSDRRVPTRRTRRGGNTRMRDPRDEQYARILVETCIDVQPGWQVVVAASPRAQPLVGEVCRALARRGAYALPRPFFALGPVPTEWIN